ncbi:unnamed protein product, partial [Mesorhabditis spiculigera]
MTHIRTTTIVRVRSLNAGICEMELNFRSDSSVYGTTARHRIRRYPDALKFDMETIAQQPNDFPGLHNGRALSAEPGDRHADVGLREKQRNRQIEREFLRSSLRSSKKLRSLENKNEVRPNGEQASDLEKGYLNPTFNDAVLKRGSGENNNSGIGLKQVMVSVDRLAEHLSKMEGREEDGQLLREYFLSDTAKRALEQAATHSQLPSTSTQQLPGEPIDGKPTKIVVIRKDADSYLGATVRNEGDRVIVGRVVRGGVAERTAAFREGDELLEINGTPLKGKTVAEVCDLMRVLSGELRFLVNPCSEAETPQTPTYVQHLRALFDYDPEDDVYVPCKELALKFQRGDILHVINTTDENWWQAYREGDDPHHSLAGLVPSSSFHQQVVMYTDELEKEQRPKTRKEARKRLPEVLKVLRRRKSNDLKPADEAAIATGVGYHSDLLTYEEVVLHLAHSDRKRPIVLCGPEGVGCLELRQNLLESDKLRFGGVVPHTTRQPVAGEISGTHYHFVSRQQFQDEAKAGHFVEWGEFEKHLYGTSAAEIRSVIAKGATCILTLKPESLTAIRNADLQPFIIFVAPPSLIVLRRQKELERARRADNTPPVRDEQLKNILTHGKAMEQKFGHLFDHIVVNMDFERSLAELRTVIRKVENEPQWVPANWMPPEQL